MGRDHVSCSLDLDYNDDSGSVKNSTVENFVKVKLTFMICLKHRRFARPFIEILVILISTLYENIFFLNGILPVT